MLKTVAVVLLASVGVVALADEAPSFDCDRAATDSEALVCATPELAQLDRELARLYGLAEAGPHMTSDRRAELVGTQRGWIEGRDDCWKADDKRACVKREYIIRIAELRQGYADARADKAAGISIGPLATECAGLDAGIATVFVNSDPGAVYLAWRDEVLVLDQVISGSGARYAAATAGGPAQYWNKGDTATLEAPGIAGTLNCTIGAGG
jgi:uncharacterized protein